MLFLEKWAYHYIAIARNVYDGDTIKADIRLGLDMWINDQSIRLFGINTPEVRGNQRKQGIFVRDWVRSQIPEDSRIVIQTHEDKRDKYGRLLASIYRPVDGQYRSLNQDLIKNGFADPYMDS